MRDAARRGETYCNLRLMSMLDEEYEKTGNREQGLGKDRT